MVVWMLMLMSVDVRISRDEGIVIMWGHGMGC